MLTIDATTAFRDALFAYSEVLDGPKPKRVPEFINGMNVLHFILRVRDFEEREQQAEVREVFEEFRNTYLNLLSTYIRLGAEMKRRGLNTPVRPGSVSPREARAISLLLVFGSEELQDAFLQGHADFKEAVVSAILADGGLYDDRGRWVELPE
jgi:hypothetical protein